MEEEVVSESEIADLRAALEAAQKERDALSPGPWYLLQRAETAETKLEAAERRIAELEKEAEDWSDKAFSRKEKMPAAEQEVERLKAGLAWIEDFAQKMTDRHTGFVHIERRARAALGEGREK